MAAAPIESVARNCLRSIPEAWVIVPSFCALIVVVVSMVDRVD
jgi:hypothetical protein